jgi:tetratricopeptide (TPR) repeat protein
MSRDLIFTSERLNVVHAETGSDTVIVTFNEMGLAANGTSFWGAELMERVGISAIGFVSVRPNWYPPLDMAPAIDAALAKIAGRRVVTYGFSQGGYGALKFGAALKADLAIAFSPQWSINPRDVSTFDQRFTSWYDATLRNGERIEQDELARRNFVFFDRAFPPDRGHATPLLAMEGVHEVTMPFTGHETIRLITEGRQGRALVELLRNARPPMPADFRKLARRARPDSASYAQGKMVQLRGSQRRHAGYLQSVVDGLPEGTPKSIAITENYLSVGSFVNAENVMASVTDADLQALYLPALWYSFREAGFLYGESRLAPLFKATHPDDVWQRLLGVNAMIVTGAKDAALEELQELAAMDGAFAHATNFMDFYGQLGRMDLAAEFMREISQNEALSKADRIRVGFDIASALAARTMRAALFRELSELSTLCYGDLDNTIRIVDMYLGIGEKSFARHVLEQLPEPAASAPLIRVYRLQLDPALEPAGMVAALRSMAREDIADPAVWMTLSRKAQEFLQPTLAIEMAQKAIAHSADYDTRARFRLAEVLAASGQHRPAAAEIETLLESDIAIRTLAQNLADLALACGRADLAVTAARRWLRTNPEHPHVQVMHCFYESKAGDGEALRHAVGALAEKARAGLPLSVEQFTMLLDSIRGKDYALERSVAEAATLQHPDIAEFQTLSKPDPFAAKFYNAAVATSPGRSRGLLEKLGLRKSR